MVTAAQVVGNVKSGDRDMPSSQAQITGLSQQIEDSSIIVAPALKGLVGFFASILRGRVRDEDDIAGRYAGCGWNDGIERQMANDIGSRHNTRL
jgi:hypothetical protein